MTDTLVILNPAARSDRARAQLARVTEMAENCDMLLTTSPGEAERMARAGAADGRYRTIVAAGGDGTINEVVNGLAGSSATLGLLPLGTVNVFASELGLPCHNLGACWDVIRRRHTRVVDVASANGKHFVQLAGVGLDAQAVKETTFAFKKSFGPLSYIISAAQIAARKPPRLHIECADTAATEASFVLVGNGRLYGGPFPFFKLARLDDGLLDVVLFKQLGYLEIIRYLQNVFFSSEIRAPEVEYFQTRALRVSADTAVPVEIDGELVGECPVTFQMEDRTLRVIVPA